MKNKPFQQGDVNFEPVSSLPTGEKRHISRENGKYVLMHGESGNLHAVEEEVDLVEINGILYMTNENAVPVKHEEHKTQIANPGIWEITPTHEYDHFLESERKVVD